MRDEDDGLVQHALQPQKLVLHFLANQGIKCRKWLVEKPYIRFSRKRPGKANTLLLATRELPREIFVASLEANKLNDLASLGLPFLFVNSLHLKRKGNVLNDVAVRQQGKVLKDHAHLVTPDFDQFIIAGTQQIRAIKINLATCRIDEFRHAAHKR